MMSTQTQKKEVPVTANAQVNLIQNDTMQTQGQLGGIGRSSGRAEAYSFNTLSINGKYIVRLGIVLLIIVVIQCITSGIGASFALDCTNETFSVFIVQIIVQIAIGVCAFFASYFYNFRVNLDFKKLADAKRDYDFTRQRLEPEDVVS